MNATVATALSAVLAKLVKSNGPLSVGTHTVDETVTIRVSGSVVKSEDEDYKPTISVPVKALAACLLSRMGATRESSIALLSEAITDALASGFKADETIRDRLKDVDEAFRLVNDRVLDTLPLQTRTGKTRVDATIAVVPATQTVSIP